MRAVLSIGSNMGNSLEFLQSCVDEFVHELVAVSSVYSTPAWGVEDQADFLNAVLIVNVADRVHPIELLRRCQRLEQAAGRERIEHWGPRTLDVDIVDIENFASDAAELTIPHPYAHERAFVLVPWQEVEPGAQLYGESLAQHLEDLEPGEVAAVRRVGHLRWGA